MPCFKGLAVSIHTPDGPLPEYSIQKNNRVSRIASYIPVPQPKLGKDNARTEPSTFAISITLLVPGQVVPYSKPPPSPENLHPEAKFVGTFPSIGDERGRYHLIGPYIPLTSSSNETIAAYIHFDGRAKEEVATLLRRGEETWVNSRWVSIPQSEGGGLAEREFLFREVGLERWLNGLDLKGESKENAERLERRRRRVEKKQQKRLAQGEKMSEENAARRRANVLRYGDSKTDPIEPVDESMSSDSESDDEMPVPEAAGQIKVSLFRVLASGEVKRGEYSPQFDAHDDDEMDKDGDGNGGTGDDIDHTTTFAKPKSLDPKTISTQTVTGIDPPEKPYATFTFFYRGKKQLQKMGILSSASTSAAPAVPLRKHKQLDASSLGSLKSTAGTVGFSGYRDSAAKAADPFQKKKLRKIPGAAADDSDMDEDSDDNTAHKLSRSEPAANGKSGGETLDDDNKNVVLSAEEVSKRGELADGVKKMQLKRQHSFEPPEPSKGTLHHAEDLSSSNADASNHTASTLNGTSSTSGSSAPASASATLGAHLNAVNPATAASPFKKARPSVSEPQANPSVSSFAGRMSAATSGELGASSPPPAPAPAPDAAAPLSLGASSASSTQPQARKDPKEMDEEL